LNGRLCQWLQSYLAFFAFLLCFCFPLLASLFILLFASMPSPLQDLCVLSY
jgi:hypothetical protein